MKLNQIRVGDAAVIMQVSEKSRIARRLLDMGFISGTKAECVFMSPMKNPRAYQVRGAVIAIRNEDAEEIEVEVI